MFKKPGSEASGPGFSLPGAPRNAINRCDFAAHQIVFLEHLPLGPNHPSGKKMLKIKELEHVLRGKVGQLFRNRLSPQSALDFRAEYVRPAPDGRLAQLVERLLYTQNVGGSSPSPPTRFRGFGHFDINRVPFRRLCHGYDALFCLHRRAAIVLSWCDRNPARRGRS